MAFLKGLSKDKSIQLYKFTGDKFKVSSDDTFVEDDRYIKVSFIDFETTGLDFERDEVIEIGLRTIAVNKLDYQDFYSVREYESYNDTHNKIDDEVAMLTGITKDMIIGKKIDWSEVENILNISNVVVAHNASFDRWFLEKHIDFKNIWACSKADIDWKDRGFLNTKLELLSIWHGFYYDSHRAMNDVNATIHLLLHPSYKKNPPLEELVENSQKEHCLIVNKFSYNKVFIDKLKKRGGYRYSPSDKSWRILVRDKNLVENEVEWLKKNIYNGYFQGEIKEIPLIDKYKIK
tara:strand:+ start:6846 stop:7718 length:873 start_codon:yes stop_codon:yes gene_type:complete